MVVGGLVIAVVLVDGEEDRRPLEQPARMAAPAPASSAPNGTLTPVSSALDGTLTPVSSAPNGTLAPAGSAPNGKVTSTDSGPDDLLPDERVALHHAIADALTADPSVAVGIDRPAELARHWDAAHG